mgnify:CR=1 FL=1
MTEEVKRFAQLFRGNTRSFGQFFPKENDHRKGRMETVKGTEPAEDHFVEHLAGRVGIGVVPVMDDSMCYFGAIDIDAHGDLPDIDLVELEQKVREHDLPLSVCRSKSGGAHLYLFGAEPLKAALVRQALSKWAEILGHGGCEIFPKQSSLAVDEDGTRQLGNWINLGLFDASNPKQLRYPVEGGKRVPLAYFLDLAESRKVTGAILVERSDTDHGGAPPCIQKMISNGVASGQRNDALYNLVVYLKQANPETWKDRAFDLNAKIFEEPLPHAEAKKTITSAGRRDYRYKCKEEPCRSLCNSQVCVTRKFGISQDEKHQLLLGKPPKFDSLRKITTDPVKWLLAVDEKDVILSTIELMDYRKVREAVADKLTRLIAPMKNETWQAILHPLMEEAKIIEAPDEASTSGIIRAKLSNYIAKTDLDSPGTDTKDREILLSGSPVVQFREDGDSKGRVVYFRGQDFVDFLKKNRSEELKGSSLWIALRDSGVGHCKLRVANSSIQVWYVWLTDDNILDLDDVEIPSEF